MIQFNLQFFAKEGPGGEKTEQATQKKLDDVRKEGQVAKSREVTHAVTLIGMFLMLKVAMGFLGENFLELFAGIYQQIPDVQGLVNGQIKTATMLNLLRTMLLRTLLMMAPFLLVGLVLSFLSDYVQIPWRVTTKPLQPKFNKLTPSMGSSGSFPPGP